MKVALLVDWTFPCDHRFLSQVYAQNFTDAGHNLVWVMRSEEDISSIHKKSWNGSPVYVLPDELYSPIRSTSQVAMNRADSHPLFTILKENLPLDVVHVRDDLGMGIVVAKFSEEYDIPFAHQISHLKAETLLEKANFQPGMERLKMYSKGVLGKPLRYHVAEKSDVVLPISHAMKIYLQKNGYSAPMAVLTTAAGGKPDLSIDPTPFIERYAIPDTELLLYMGSMNPTRDLSFLFDSLKRVKKEREVTLLMIGGRDQEARKTLQQAAKEKGVDDSVIFTGWISDSEMISQALDVADIGLSAFPPHIFFKTNAPIKVLEYLSHKTPAVVTDTPDQRTVISESGAGVVTEYTPTAFANGIISLLSSGNLEQRGAAGREYVAQNRSYDQLTHIALSIYKQIV